jgi:hypothetical protein
MKQSRVSVNSIGVAVSPFADGTLSLGTSRAYSIKPPFRNFSIHGVHVQRNSDFVAHTEWINGRGSFVEIMIEEMKTTKCQPKKINFSQIHHR